ncbi:MAG: inorganic phosphate transporter, partial [Bacteroidaceae bacterium]|nr:inorganic phosphate transporter [Bacteroidaceae bacterium]
MNTLFIGIVGFLIVLAVFDLVVGVSNDAVNFINSAIGAKAAKYRTIVAVSAVGVFIGAALSNGMMDVARHGIFTPEYYSFYEVMCIFLAVMVTDVILLDIFNTLGMPTSTTVSMVFELLGGAFALSLVKIIKGTVNSSGELLGMGDLINTDKALSVILAIFLSVAVAFVFGLIVQWLSRITFTFTYRRNARLKTMLFAAIAVTSIIWFLLINGLKGSSLMTADVKEWISANTLCILGSCLSGSLVLMGILSLLRVNLLQVVVLLGTFALAMAFAGNDLVNFVGVPLTGLDAYLDYSANGSGDAYGFQMESLAGSAQTPILFLIGAGLIMVLSLIFSKKAQNVVKTSVDLSRQDEGDEMFGSSGVARRIVRSCTQAASTVSQFIPKRISRWVDSRFNAYEAVLPKNAAFDMIRASINLVLAGLLVALGTSFKLPLSTTYVTFMVAMGSSLADRAWSRESAVFRVTGVLSVIGGWFITAGAAFTLCFIVASLMYFGSFPLMLAAIATAIFLLVRSHIRFGQKKEESKPDELFNQILRNRNPEECLILLREHIRLGNAEHVKYVADCYRSITDAMLGDDYKTLKRSNRTIETQRKQLKRQRRREIIALRRIDPIYAIDHNTWYYLGITSCEQMLYCMMRISDPCLEHLGNNFAPIPSRFAMEFVSLRDEVVRMYNDALQSLSAEGGLEFSAIRTR